jgi:hypothetical protein
MMQGITDASSRTMRRHVLFRFVRTGALVVRFASECCFGAWSAMSGGGRVTQQFVCTPFSLLILGLASGAFVLADWSATADKQ